MPGCDLRFTRTCRTPPRVASFLRFESPCTTLSPPDTGEPHARAQLSHRHAGWIDLTSSDPKKAIEFYRDLFGWQADTNEDPQYGGYTIFSHRGAPIAGLGPQQPGNPYGDVWTVYLDSEDADATAQKAASAGGQVMMPAMKVGDQAPWRSSRPGRRRDRRVAGRSAPRIRVRQRTGGHLSGSRRCRRTTPVPSRSTGKCSGGTVSR